LKKKVSRTNPRDVNPAVTRVKAAAAEDRARCLTQSVLPVAQAAKFLSSPGMIALFIAATVFQPNDKHKNTPSGVFLCV